MKRFDIEKKNTVHHFQPDKNGDLVCSCEQCIFIEEKRKHEDIIGIANDITMAAFQLWRKDLL